MQPGMGNTRNPPEILCANVSKVGVCVFRHAGSFVLPASGEIAGAIGMIGSLRPFSRTEA